MSDVTKGVLVKLYCAVITDEAPVNVPVALFYTKENPFQVTFIADQHTDTGGHVEWNYSRELLYNAMHGEEEVIYGEGDVQTFREHGFVYTIFHQEDRKVLLAFLPGDISIFLAATEDLCPMGEESLSEEDMDAELAVLLGEES